VALPALDPHQGVGRGEGRTVTQWSAGIRIAKGGAFWFPPFKDPFLVLSSSFFAYLSSPFHCLVVWLPRPFCIFFLGSSLFSSFLPNIVEVHIFPVFIDDAFFKDLVISVFFITSFISKFLLSIFHRGIFTS